MPLKQNNKMILSIHSMIIAVKQHLQLPTLWQFDNTAPPPNSFNRHFVRFIISIGRF